jgi:hypothetical protein
MDLREREWVLTGLIWLRTLTSEGFCEDGNEPLDSIKHWEILELLSDWWLLKKNSAPWS